MKKMINKPENIVDELLEGFSMAFSDKIKLTDSRIITRITPKDKEKVALVSLGGAGHEPALIGFVGHGMLDATVAGEIFAAPAPNRCIDAIKLADRGAGVLFLVLNHTGDVLTANYTMEMAKKQGLNVRMLLVNDDIASGPREKPEERRGMVGILPVIKIAGTAAESGLSLDEVFDIAQQVSNNTRTLSVGFTIATHPVTGMTISTISQNEMIMGMGQHGEAGGNLMSMQSADEVADLMLSQLIEDLGVKAQDQLLVILNGSGATTLMELFIIFRRVRHILAKNNIKAIRNKIGEFLTTQEQAGFQMNITKLNAPLTDFWDSPCDAPYFVA